MYFIAQELKGVALALLNISQDRQILVNFSNILGPVIVVRGYTICFDLIVLRLDVISYQASKWVFSAF